MIIASDVEPCELSYRIQEKSKKGDKDVVDGDDDGERGR